MAISEFFELEAFFSYTDFNRTPSSQSQPKSDRLPSNEKEGQLPPPDSLTIVMTSDRAHHCQIVLSAIAPLAC
ncbi:hypothetical protein [Microcoleus sp. BROC3]|uniref:hypothetical protein n=1 Tax=Microcoleus sp. BROC3 TaxID=3055323 RepID=UPI002FD4C0D2